MSGASSVSRLHISLVLETDFLQEQKATNPSCLYTSIEKNRTKLTAKMKPVFHHIVPSSQHLSSSGARPPLLWLSSCSLTALQAPAGDQCLWSAVTLMVHIILKGSSQKTLLLTLFVRTQRPVEGRKRSMQTILLHVLWSLFFKQLKFLLDSENKSTSCVTISDSKRCHLQIISPHRCLGFCRLTASIGGEISLNDEPLVPKGPSGADRVPRGNKVLWPFFICFVSLCCGALRRPPESK